MKIFFLLIIMQILYPTYEFKSTSPYLECTQNHLELEDNSYNRPGPRKVSGIDGWAWWILWGSSHNVPSDATNELMYSYYDYVQAGGTLSYQDWLNSQSVPIGDAYLFIFVMCAIYILIKMRKEIISKKSKRAL